MITGTGEFRDVSGNRREERPLSPNVANVALVALVALVAFVARLLAFGFERTHTCYNARRMPIPARDKVLGNERA